MTPATCPICAAPLPAATIRAPDRLHGTPGDFAVAVCATCGAGVTLPRVTGDELAAFYPSDYAPFGAQATRVTAALSSAIRAWRTGASPVSGSRARSRRSRGTT